MTNVVRPNFKKPKWTPEMVHNGLALISALSDHRYVVCRVWDGEQKYVIMDVDLWDSFGGAPQTAEEIANTLNAPTFEWATPDRKNGSKW